jgi:hypothetical protein
MKHHVDFDSMAWESPMPGVRQKVYRFESRILRLVEYSRGMAPHWCERGHIGHVVQGRISIEFLQGVELFDSGDAVFIPSGPEHVHRATPLTAVVTAMFVEDSG